jgi:hypothetical protein
MSSLDYSRGYEDGTNAAMAVERSIQGRLRKAEDELAALRKDAERYCFLREGNLGTYNIIMRNAGTALDSAIDEAMAKKRPD